eukprot:765595_1
MNQNHTIHSKSHSNSDAKRPSHPFLWTSTYIRTDKPSKVYLYILRNKQNPHEGTRPISVSPHQYLFQLNKHSISLESLYIPHQFCWNTHLFRHQYGFSKSDAAVAKATTRQLWDIIQSQLMLQQSTKKSDDDNVFSEHLNTDPPQSIHSKLDFIINKLNAQEHVQQTRHQIAPTDSSSDQYRFERENQVLKNIVNTQKRDIIDLHTKNQKLQQEKTQKIKNIYYYKHIAQEQRNTLHRIGLSYGTNTAVRCHSNVGYRQLMRRVQFIQHYIDTLYGTNSECIMRLVEKYIMTTSEIKQHLYEHVFRSDFVNEYNKEIRKFELDLTHAERCMIAYHHKCVSRSTQNEIRCANSYSKREYTLSFGMFLCVRVYVDGLTLYILSS